MSRSYLLPAVGLFLVLLVVGLTVLWMYPSQPTNADAQLGRPKSESMGVVLVTGSVDPKSKALPEQKIHDMTFVYSDGD
ncbi:MAG: hypothetical protein WB760_21940 [Xanthobacteraceae bacterium]